MYTDYHNAVTGKYKHKLVIDSELGDFVSFAPAMKLPFHRWFYYKQGFSPQFVRHCISDAGIQPGATILDPFSGVGTTPYTATCLSYNAIGIDILPLAKFICESKLADDYDSQVIRSELEGLMRDPPRNAERGWPEVKVISKAYDEEMAERIQAYRERILTIEDEAARRFLLMCLFGILSQLSKTKKDGGFLRIIDTPRSTDIDLSFRERAEILLEDIEMHETPLPFVPEELSGLRPDPAVSCELMTGDVREMDVSDSSVDLIVTSPPYLNKTDYTRVYSLELCMHFVDNFEQLRKLRYDSIRGNVEARYGPTERFFPIDLEAAVAELKKRKLSNPRHPEMVVGYFEDMYLMLSEFHRVLKPGGRAYIVNWNTRFSGVMFEVDSICAEMAEYVGFELEKIIIVNLKGSSSQQVKLYGEKAIRESVLVLRKNDSID
tara:strand:- start:22 stop:1326 length:1305 start_codon:yes stop_codon:yes gene_type:complete